MRGTIERRAQGDAAPSESQACAQACDLEMRRHARSGTSARSVARTIASRLASDCARAGRARCSCSCSCARARAHAHAHAHARCSCLCRSPCPCLCPCPSGIVVGCRSPFGRDGGFAGGVPVPTPAPLWDRCWVPIAVRRRQRGTSPAEWICAQAAHLMLCSGGHPAHTKPQGFSQGFGSRDC